MKTDTARAIQLSEMDTMRIRRLHEYELKIGRTLTPSQINEIGRLKRHGDLEPSLWEPQERFIAAITRGELEKYMSDQTSAGEIVNMIEFQHLLDLIIHRRVSFIVPDRSDLARVTRRSLSNPEAA